MRVPLLLAASLALAAPAEAFPLRYMGWGDAYPGEFDHSPSCAALPATSTLVVAFDAAEPDLVGLSGYIDFCTRPNTLPEWWRFDDVEGCRYWAFTVSTDFSGGPSSHPSPWGGGAVVDYWMEYPFGGPAMARIWFDITTPDGNPVPLSIGERYYAFRIVFDNWAAGCTGCEVPACFVLNGLLHHHSEGITATEMDYSNWAKWQGGTFDCPLIVPTLSSSWGSVKAIYR